VGRKPTPDLPQGTLDMLVLKALSLGPMHGYGIGQRIQQLAQDMLRVEEGGWIKSAWGVSDTNRRARFYRLTRAGRRRLTAEAADWQHLALAIRRVMQAT
jgi:PadR family transcriptional regulator, regulatory protein PadR